jgi:hypothetical protein
VFSSLSGEETLCLVSVAFSLAILLVCVLHVDLFVHEELLVHAFYRFIGGFEGVIGDKTKSLRDTGVISRNL